MQPRQNAISRLEKADYGNLNANTLLRLASAFDVALLIKFVPFRKLVEEFADLSTQALSVPSFDSELPELEEFASSAITTVTTTTRTQTRTLTDIPEISMEDFVEANLHWFVYDPHSKLTIYKQNTEAQSDLLPGVITKGSDTNTLTSQMVN